MYFNLLDEITPSFFLAVFKFPKSNILFELRKPVIAHLIRFKQVNSREATFNYFSFPLRRLQQRIWRKIWMTLFKPSSTGVGRLEISNVLDTNPITDQKKAGRLRTSERKVVRLSDCVSVTHAPKESCPKGHTAFYLNTIQSTYTLASMMSQDWISALCLLAFQVLCMLHV